MTQHSRALLSAVHSLIETRQYLAVEYCLEILAPHRKENVDIQSCFKLLEACEVLISANVIPPILLEQTQHLITQWTEQ